MSKKPEWNRGIPPPSRYSDEAFFCVQQRSDCKSFIGQPAEKRPMRTRLVLCEFIYY